MGRGVRILSKCLIRLSNKRGIAVLVLTAFLVQDFAWAAAGLPGQPLTPNPAAPTGIASNLTLADLIADPSRLPLPSGQMILRDHHAGRNGKLIIHIQDAHGNYPAQKNLADSLAFWMDAFPQLRLVTVEGGDGDATLDTMRRAVPAAMWKHAAPQMLRDGLITGEEFLNLSTERPMRIEGVERQKQYDDNRAAYARIADMRPTLTPALHRMRAAIDALKARLYPQAILDYESALGRAEERDAWDMTLRSDALAVLPESVRPEAGRYPVWESWQTLRRAEAELESTVLENETQRLLLALPADHPAVLRLRSGRANDPAAALEVWTRLRDAAAAAGVQTGPTLDRYLDGLRTASELDVEALQRESDLIEQDVYSKLLQGEDTNRLHQLDQYLSLLGSAILLRLDSGQSAALGAGVRAFPSRHALAWLNRQLADRDLERYWVPYDRRVDRALRFVRKFYSLAADRDKTFVRKVDEAMMAGGQSAAFFIAGGYHSSRITRMLAELGYSVVTVTPMTDQETDWKTYERVLLPELNNKLSAQSNHLSHIRQAPAAKELGARLAGMAKQRSAAYGQIAHMIDRLPASDAAGGRTPSAARMSSAQTDHLQKYRYFGEWKYSLTAEEWGLLRAYNGWGLQGGKPIDPRSDVIPNAEERFMDRVYKEKAARLRRVNPGEYADLVAQTVAKMDLLLDRLQGAQSNPGKAMTASWLLDEPETPYLTLLAVLKSWRDEGSDGRVAWIVLGHAYGVGRHRSSTRGLIDDVNASLRLEKEESLTQDGLYDRLESFTAAFKQKLRDHEEQRRAFQGKAQGELSDELKDELTRFRSAHSSQRGRTRSRHPVLPVSLETDYPLLHAYLLNAPDKSRPVIAGFLGLPREIFKNKRNAEFANTYGLQMGKKGTKLVGPILQGLEDHKARGSAFGEGRQIHYKAAAVLLNVSETSMYHWVDANPALAQSYGIYMSQRRKKTQPKAEARTPASPAADDKGARMAGVSGQGAGAWDGWLDHLSKTRQVSNNHEVAAAAISMLVSLNYNSSLTPQELAQKQWKVIEARTQMGVLPDRKKQLEPLFLASMSIVAGDIIGLLESADKGDAESIEVLRDAGRHAARIMPQSLIENSPYGISPYEPDVILSFGQLLDRLKDKSKQTTAAPENDLPHLELMPGMNGVAHLHSIKNKEHEVWVVDRSPFIEGAYEETVKNLGLEQQVWFIRGDVLDLPGLTDPKTGEKLSDMRFGSVGWRNVDSYLLSSARINDELADNLIQFILSQTQGHIFEKIPMSALDRSAEGFGDRYREALMQRAALGSVGLRVGALDPESGLTESGWTLTIATEPTYQNDGLFVWSRSLELHPDSGSTDPSAARMSVASEVNEFITNNLDRWTVLTRGYGEMATLRSGQSRDATLRNSIRTFWEAFRLIDTAGADGWDQFTGLLRRLTFKTSSFLKLEMGRPHRIYGDIRSRLKAAIESAVSRADGSGENAAIVINTIVLGPGFGQELIELRIMFDGIIEEIGLGQRGIELNIKAVDLDESAVEPEWQTGIQKKLLANEIYYDPSDVDALVKHRVLGPAPDFSLGQYFIPEERGYRLKPEVHGGFEFVYTDLSDPSRLGWLESLAGSQDLILANNTMTYLPTEARVVVFQKLSSALRPGASMLVTESGKERAEFMSLLHKTDNPLWQMIKFMYTPTNDSYGYVVEAPNEIVSDQARGARMSRAERINHAMDAAELTIRKMKALQDLIWSLEFLEARVREQDDLPWLRVMSRGYFDRLNERLTAFGDEALDRFVARILEESGLDRSGELADPDGIFEELEPALVVQHRIMSLHRLRDGIHDAPTHRELHDHLLNLAEASSRSFSGEDTDAAAGAQIASRAQSLMTSLSELLGVYARVARKAIERNAEAREMDRHLEMMESVRQAFAAMWDLSVMAWVRAPENSMEMFRELGEELRTSESEQRLIRRRMTEYLSTPQTTQADLIPPETSGTFDQVPFDVVFDRENEFRRLFSEQWTIEQEQWKRYQRAIRLWLDVHREGRGLTVQDLSSEVEAYHAVLTAADGTSETFLGVVARSLAVLRRAGGMRRHLRSDLANMGLSAIRVRNLKGDMADQWDAVLAADESEVAPLLTALQLSYRARVRRAGADAEMDGLSLLQKIPVAGLHGSGITEEANSIHLDRVVLESFEDGHRIVMLSGLAATIEARARWLRLAELSRQSIGDPATQDQQLMEAAEDMIVHNRELGDGVYAVLANELVVLMQMPVNEAEKAASIRVRVQANSSEPSMQDFLRRSESWYLSEMRQAGEMGRRLRQMLKQPQIWHSTDSGTRSAEYRQIVLYINRLLDLLKANAMMVRVLISGDHLDDAEAWLDAAEDLRPAVITAARSLGPLVLAGEPAGEAHANTSLRELIDQERFLREAWLRIPDAVSSSQKGEAVKAVNRLRARVSRNLVWPALLIASGRAPGKDAKQSLLVRVLNAAEALNHAIGEPDAMQDNAPDPDQTREHAQYVLRGMIGFERQKLQAFGGTPVSAEGGDDGKRLGPILGENGLGVEDLAGMLGAYETSENEAFPIHHERAMLRLIVLELALAKYDHRDDGSSGARMADAPEAESRPGTRAKSPDVNQWTRRGFVQALTAWAGAAWVPQAARSQDRPRPSDQSSWLLHDPDGSVVLGEAAPGIAYYPDREANDLSPLDYRQLLDTAQGGRSQAQKIYDAGFRVIKIYLTPTDDPDAIAKITQMIHQHPSHPLKTIVVYSPHVMRLFDQSAEERRIMIDRTASAFAKQPWVHLQLGNEDNYYRVGQKLGAADGIELSREDYFKTYDDIAGELKSAVERRGGVNRPVLLGHGYDPFAPDSDRDLRLIAKMKNVDALAVNLYLDHPAFYTAALKHLSRELPNLPVIVGEFGASRLHQDPNAQISSNVSVWSGIRQGMRDGYAAGAVLFAWSDKSVGQEAPGASEAFKAYDRVFGIRDSGAAGVEYYGQSPPRSGTPTATDNSSDASFWKAAGLWKIDSEASVPYFEGYLESKEPSAITQAGAMLQLLKDAAADGREPLDSEVNGLQDFHRSAAAHYYLATAALFRRDWGALSAHAQSLAEHYADAQVYYGESTFWSPAGALHGVLRLFEEPGATEASDGIRRALKHLERIPGEKLAPDAAPARSWFADQQYGSGQGDDYRTWYKKLNAPLRIGPEASLIKVRIRPLSPRIGAESFRVVIRLLAPPRWPGASPGKYTRTVDIRGDETRVILIPLSEVRRELGATFDLMQLEAAVLEIREDGSSAHLEGEALRLPPQFELYEPSGARMAAQKANLIDAVWGGALRWVERLRDPGQEESELQFVRAIDEMAKRTARQEPGRSSSSDLLFASIMFAPPSSEADGAEASAEGPLGYALSFNEREPSVYAATISENDLEQVWRQSRPGLTKTNVPFIKFKAPTYDRDYLGEYQAPGAGNPGIFWKKSSGLEQTSEVRSVRVRIDIRPRVSASDEPAIVVEIVPDAFLPGLERLRLYEQAARYMDRVLAGSKAVSGGQWPVVRMIAYDSIERIVDMLPANETARHGGVRQAFDHYLGRPAVKHWIFGGPRGARMADPKDMHDRRKTMFRNMPNIIEGGGQIINLEYSEPKKNHYRIQALSDNRVVGQADFRLETGILLEREILSAVMDSGHDLTAEGERTVALEVDGGFRVEFKGLGSTLLSLAFRASAAAGAQEFIVRNSLTDDFYRSAGMMNIYEHDFWRPLDAERSSDWMLRFPALAIESRKTSGTRLAEPELYEPSAARMAVTPEREAKDRLETAIFMPNHGGPLDLPHFLMTTGIYAITLKYPLDLSKGDAERMDDRNVSREKAREMRLAKPNLLTEGGAEMLRRARILSTEYGELTSYGSDLKSGDPEALSADRVSQMTRRTIEFYRRVADLASEAHALLARDTDRMIEAWELASKAAKHNRLTDDALRDYDKLSRRWVFNSRIFEEYLRSDPPSAEPVEINSWLGSLMSKGALQTKADSRVPTGSDTTPFQLLRSQSDASVRTSPGLLHLLIERILSNGYHAMNRQKVETPPTVRVIPHPAKGLVRIQIITEGDFEKRDLLLEDPDTGWQKIVTLQPDREHTDHGIGMPTANLALRRVTPGSQIRFRTYKGKNDRPYVEISFVLPMEPSTAVAARMAAEPLIDLKYRTAKSDPALVANILERVRVFRGLKPAVPADTLTEEDGRSALRAIFVERFGEGLAAPMSPYERELFEFFVSRPEIPMHFHADEFGPRDLGSFSYQDENGRRWRDPGVGVYEPGAERVSWVLGSQHAEILTPEASYRMMLHEMSHVYDGMNEIASIDARIASEDLDPGEVFGPYTGYLGPDRGFQGGPAISHRLSYREFKANLWSTDGNVEVAYDRTLRSYPNLLEQTIQPPLDLDPAYPRDEIYLIFKRLSEDPASNRHLNMDRDEDLELLWRAATQARRELGRPERTPGTAAARMAGDSPAPEIVDLLGEHRPASTRMEHVGDRVIKADRGPGRSATALALELIDNAAPGKLKADSAVLLVGGTLGEFREVRKRYPQSRVAILNTDRAELQSVVQAYASGEGVPVGSMPELYLADVSHWNSRAIANEGDFDLVYAGGLDQTAFASNPELVGTIQNMIAQELEWVRDDGIIYHPADGFWQGFVDAGIVRPMIAGDTDRFVQTGIFVKMPSAARMAKDSKPRKTKTASTGRNLKLIEVQQEGSLAQTHISKPGAKILLPDGTTVTDSVIMYLDALNIEPKTILLTGGTLEELITFMRRYPEAEVHVINSDPGVLKEIIDSKNPLLSRSNAPITLYLADASKPVPQIKSGTYDLIYAGGLDETAFKGNYGTPNRIISAMAANEIAWAKEGALICHLSDAEHWQDAIKRGMVRPVRNAMAGLVIKTAATQSGEESAGARMAYVPFGRLDQLQANRLAEAMDDARRGGMPQGPVPVELTGQYTLVPSGARAAASPEAVTAAVDSPDMISGHLNYLDRMEEETRKIRSALATLLGSGTVSGAAGKLRAEVIFTLKPVLGPSAAADQRAMDAWRAAMKLSVLGVSERLDQEGIHLAVNYDTSDPELLRNLGDDFRPDPRLAGARIHVVNDTAAAFEGELNRLRFYAAPDGLSEGAFRLMNLEGIGLVAGSIAKLTDGRSPSELLSTGDLPKVGSAWTILANADGDGSGVGLGWNADTAYAVLVGEADPETRQKYSAKARSLGARLSAWIQVLQTALSAARIAA